jgi:hypothetical protein
MRSGGWKNLKKIHKSGQWISVLWRVKFFKIGKHDFRFIREMRVEDVGRYRVSHIEMDKVN